MVTDFDIAGLDFSQKLAEIQRPVGLLWPWWTTAHSSTATQTSTTQKIIVFTFEFTMPLYENRPRTRMSRGQPRLL